MAAPTQRTNLIMHRATESELEESANGSVAKGKLVRASFVATTVALTNTHLLMEGWGVLRSSGTPKRPG
jgi:hypothetical protein